MRLTFENGDFVLHKGKSKATVELKYVRDFEKYADPKAKHVINRTFNKLYLEPELPPLKFLDHHQREGIQWILSRKRSYLAHAPGAGKTCQAILAALQIPYSGPALLIVPPNLMMNWQREIKWVSQALGVLSTALTISSLMDGSTLPNPSDVDFILCADTMIHKKEIYQYLLRAKPKLIAVDEASRFKEFTSVRSQAFYGGHNKGIDFPGLFQNARHTVFLDGSPMPNRPLELWTPTFALSPESIDCMDYAAFGFRYCGATVNDRGSWEFKHSSHEDELKRKLQKNFMHVVAEDQLEHPERRRSLLFMTEDIRTPEMKAWERKNLPLIKFGNLTDDTRNAQLIEHRWDIGIRKVKWVSRYVADRLDSTKESILLFAWHREVCEDLADCLRKYDPVVIYGGVKVSEREKAFRAYQRGEKRIIIGNIQAMGRGNNLQKTDRIVFCEYSWSDELNKQCEKRGSRRGSTKAFVRCDYVVLPDSFDEVMLGSVMGKEKRVKKVIG